MARKDYVRQEQFLVPVCIAVLSIILSLGLWPFHAPVNDVAWLGTRNGLRLGRHGTVIGTAPVQAASAGAGSLEIWVQPAGRWNGGTILSFSQPRHSLGLRVEQSQTDLAFEFSDKTRKLYVNEIFRPTKPRFITVTSGGSGTVVYVDGISAKKVPQLELSPEEFGGRLILGDAPGQTDNWSGMLLGAAVYRRELTSTEVLNHYQSWAEKGRPEIAGSEACTALYLFGERFGSIVHNQIARGPALQIPASYVVVDQRFLEPFWEEFSLSRKYGSAALKNIVGFLPVGFVFYAYLAGVRGLRRAVLFTVLLGTLVSLTIEVIQGFLPTRDSGTSDLITNTLGTWLGVLLYLRLHHGLAKTFPWLPLFPWPRR